MTEPPWIVRFSGVPLSRCHPVDGRQQPESPWRLFATKRRERVDAGQHASRFLGTEGLLSGIPIDEAVISSKFAYLRNCQRCGADQRLRAVGTAMLPAARFLFLRENVPR